MKKRTLSCALKNLLMLLLHIVAKKNIHRIYIYIQISLFSHVKKKPALFIIRKSYPYPSSPIAHEKEKVAPELKN